MVSENESQVERSLLKNENPKKRLPENESQWKDPSWKEEPKVKEEGSPFVNKTNIILFS